MNIKSKIWCRHAWRLLAKKTFQRKHFSDCVKARDLKIGAGYDI
jgi:hypothetical protein